MKTIADQLKTHPFFQAFNASTIEQLGGCGRHIQFEPDEQIAKAETPADAFYIVQSGHVAIEIMHPSRGPMMLQTLGSDDILGWSWLFPPYQWTYDIRAIEATRAIKMDGACLRGKCEADPAMGYELMKNFASVITNRLHSTRLRLLDLYEEVPA